MAMEKNLSLDFVKLNELPKYLIGDSARLRQLLLNLVSNAIKFTDSGGVKISLASKQLGNDVVMLRVSVNDTGIGIKDEYKEKLFTEFRQGDTSINRRYGGTGLGLAICKRIVDLMGGEISVESEVGA